MQDGFATGNEWLHCIALDQNEICCRDDGCLAAMGQKDVTSAKILEHVMMGRGVEVDWTDVNKVEYRTMIRGCYRSSGNNRLCNHARATNCRGATQPIFQTEISWSWSFLPIGRSAAVTASSCICKANVMGVVLFVTVLISRLILHVATLFECADGWPRSLPEDVSPLWRCQVHGSGHGC